MSDRPFETRRESTHNGNYIPSGRQLHRTPPLSEVKKRLDFSNDGANKDYENMEQQAGKAADEDDSQPNKTFDFNTAKKKAEPDEHPMLKGMKGYELTPSDMEFIRKMQEEKLIKQLERSLMELQRLLKKETMAAEMVFASREKAQAELKKFPSCEELSEWVKKVLHTKMTPAEIEDLDTKSLLLMVAKEDVKNVVDERRIELARMETLMEKNKKKELKEKEQLQRLISRDQLKLHGLMSQLSGLKSELAQQEETYKVLERQIDNKEAEKIKAEAEQVDVSEEAQATKTPATQGGRGRKKAVKSTDKLQDTTNQSQPTRNKVTDLETSVKSDHADKNTIESLQKKRRSRAAAEKPTRSVKAVGRPQIKVEEEKESNPQESERPVRGKRKLPARDSQPKNPSKVKTGEPPTSRQKAAVAADEVGLRRSKRIASRR